MMADDGKTIVVLVGYILAILEAFPLGLIFALALYLLSDDEYYKHHAKYMLIISVVLSLIILIFFGGMILAILGMAATSNATTALI